MQTTWFRRGMRLIAALIGLAALMLAAVPTQAAPWDGKRNQFADSGFQTVWTRTDAEAVRGGRSWYWGPQPWFDYAEFYREGVNGLRTVQYFDKARMEINNPNDRSYQNGVTNGLLVVELVSGHLKKGNDPFDYSGLQSADVPVAGDPKAANPNAPTYAVFANLATVDNNGYKDPNRLNQTIGATLDKSGNISFRQDLARPETTIVQYNAQTGHNIPQVFWNFLNLQGPFIENGIVRNGPIVDWTFAMGLPITDAYWMRAKIGGVEKDVLTQLFERRVLTYVPDNPPGYQVEMGNVGQHYFQWRYPHLGTPWATPEFSLPLIYASKIDTGQYWELYLAGPDNGFRITKNNAETVAFSYRRSWDPGQVSLLVDSRRGDGQYRQIYALDASAIYSGDFAPNARVRRIITSEGAHPPTTPYPAPGGLANDYNPSVSPDGTKLVFVSDRLGVPQLFIMPLDGENPQRLNFDGCLTQVPTWSPDGRSLYWEQQCGGGKFVIMKGDLSYTNDDTYGVDATLTNFKQLTDGSSDNRFPRVSPDGRYVAYTNYSAGNGEIYISDTEFTYVIRQTDNPAEDKAATWSADGRQLVFASNRDGNYDIYMMNPDGSGQTRQTFNTADDDWPLWAQ